MRPRLLLPLLVLAALGLSGSVTATAAPLQHVDWWAGFAVPGTPAKYNKVGVLKFGPASARNVLVLEPGTSAGSAYFAPLARSIVAAVPGWQVWAVERRENLLEDHSVLDRAKTGRASARQMFDYYLGFLKDSRIKHHFQFLDNHKLTFARAWGMKVAVMDLHTVISAARDLGGHVVLGGHSLGGAVVTAYATWDFSGVPGAADLDGLLYIDGGGFRVVSASQARSELRTLNSGSPWLTFGGIAAPFAGLFNATGSTAALIAPDERSLGQQSGLLNLSFPDHRSLTPAVPVSNAAQYGYALNVATSPGALVAAQAHLGRGLARHPVHGVYGWDGRGALTPLDRFATMFSGMGVASTDGTEWYFPQRLTDDTGAVGSGIRNPAQSVLDVDATMGRLLPHRLLIYAFGAALGGRAVLDAARKLAAQSGIPASHLTLLDRHSTYAHNDPAGAFPRNDFFSALEGWLKRVARAG